MNPTNLIYTDKMTNSTTLSVPELLQSAVQLHRQGQLAQANGIYAQILQISPGHFDALHFSGVIAKQTGQPEKAMELISAAINLYRSEFNAGHASAFCNLGAACQECSQPGLAVSHYQTAIRLKPDYAMAHNNLGNALKNLGRHHEALASYRNAIRFAPDYPEAFYHCGLVLHLIGQFEEALPYFERALQIRPAYAQACNAMGISLHSLGRYADAVDYYSRAIELMADFAQACFNRGISYNRLRSFDQAVADFESAIAYQPNYPNAWFYLGNSLRQLNKTELAIAAYQRARELGAAPDQIDFLLATLGAGAMPKAPPAAYVSELFDQYADHFDVHLTQVLQYAVPELISTTLAPHLQNGPVDCLDLGCGTGLCAGFLRRHAGSLTGVDLSQNMLEQAARLNLYDDLVCAEITDFLFRSGQQFDLITAADVLVYLGDLNQLMQGVARVLRAHGLFCFSVEHFNNDGHGTDYILQTTARYAHSADYLRQLAQQHGLTLIEMHQHTGRQENQNSSEALIVLLQKVAGKQQV